MAHSYEKPIWRRAFSNTPPALVVVVGLIAVASAIVVAAIVFQNSNDRQSHARPNAVIQVPGGGVLALAFAPDGKTLIAGGTSGRVSIIDWRNASVARHFKAHDGAVYCLDVSADGVYVASAGSDRRARIWQLATSHLAEDHMLAEVVTDVAVLAEQGCMLVRSVDGDVTALDVLSHDDGLPSEPNPQDSLMKSKAPTGTRTAVSPDGCHIAQGFDDGRIIISTSLDSTTTLTIDTQESQVNCLVFHPSGTCVAAGGGQTAHPSTLSPSTAYSSIWDARDGHLIADLGGHHESVVAIAFSPDGAYLASSDLGGRVLVWDVSRAVQDE